MRIIRKIDNEKKEFTIKFGESFRKLEISKDSTVEVSLTPHAEEENVYNLSVIFRDLQGTYPIFKNEKTQPDLNIEVSTVKNQIEIKVIDDGIHHHLIRESLGKKSGTFTSENLKRSNWTGSSEQSKKTDNGVGNAVTDTAVDYSVIKNNQMQ